MKENLEKKYNQLPEARFSHANNTWFFRDQRLWNVNPLIEAISIEIVRYVFETLGKEYLESDLTRQKMNEYLLSEEGLGALYDYHQKLRREYQARREAS